MERKEFDPSIELYVNLRQVLWQYLQYAHPPAGPGPTKGVGNQNGESVSDAILFRPS